MANAVKTVLNTLLSVELWIRRRYNEETKFSVTPSLVLRREHETRSLVLGVTENFVSSLYLLLPTNSFTYIYIYICTVSPFYDLAVTPSLVLRREHETRSLVLRREHETRSLVLGVKENFVSSLYLLLPTNSSLIYIYIYVRSHLSMI